MGGFAETIDGGADDGLWGLFRPDGDVSWQHRALCAQTDPEAFFPAALIETGALNIASELADRRNLQALDRPDFVAALAHVYDELGYLHPFRGGNAMTLRIFASRLSHDAGWDLDWGTVTREEYKSAKRLAYRGDLTGFERLFDRIVRPANPTRVFLIAGWDQGPAH